MILDIAVRHKRWDMLDVCLVQLLQGDSFLLNINRRTRCTTGEYAPAVLEMDELRVKLGPALFPFEELDGDVATSERRGPGTRVCQRGTIGLS